MLDLVKSNISNKSLQVMVELLEYETAVFPPVVTIYLHQKHGDVLCQFTLEGLNVCENEVGIWVTYSKTRSTADKIHTQIGAFMFNPNDIDFEKAQTYCAEVISKWLNAKAIADGLIKGAENG